MPLAAIATKAARCSPRRIGASSLRLRTAPRLVDDSYNANPTATKRALDVLAGAGAARRIAVLGEMLELGERAIALHEDVGRAAAGAGVDVLLAVGGAPAMALAAQRRRARRRTCAFATATRRAGGPSLVRRGRSRAREGIARREDGSRGRTAEGGARLMLYHLLYPFHTQLSVLNVTRYITFRTAAASLSALAISLAFGPWLIRKLREFQIGQVIRQEGPTTHRPKAGHADDGRLLILTAALVPTLLWADLTNAYMSGSRC